VKGTGHDYLGRSSAPDSLLIWTHQMRQVTVDDAFVPHGCASAPIPAVTVDAGTRWLEAYREVTVRHGRYVQGGGCVSVGAAGGFLQGGGFGSWSKKYGIAAAGMLEAEVVTADGQLVIANRCNHADLFWALRGGGGGTFGVVTRVTLMTHALPDYFGHIGGEISAASDAAFQELLEHFVAFYREQLSNEHWGEQVQVRRDNKLELSLAFEGMRARDAEQVWQPFRAWLAEHPERFQVHFEAVELPAGQMWSFEFFRRYASEVIRADDRTDHAGQFWWAGDGEQVSAYWYGYQSRWIPLDRFEGAEAPKLAAALFAASRHWQVGLHFNKGQAGASADAVERGHQTAMNPAVFRAAALAIVGDFETAAPGVRGHEPDIAAGRAARAAIAAAMQVLREETPDAGSYVNETDYFEPDWQRSFWGDNYPRLLAIKRAYDPANLFTCHHCVGSEGVVP
jgi:FAD/FMN-containing dehydrogenase